MTTKPVHISSIKKGNYVIMDNVASTVVDIQVSRPGKHGHAKYRVSAVGIIDGKKRVVVMPGHDSIDVPIIDKRVAQALSVQGDTVNIMDSESYETFDLPIPDEFKGQIVDGVNLVYWVIMGDKVIKQVRGS